jgi:hypothetical protein
MAAWLRVVQKRRGVGSSDEDDDDEDRMVAANGRAKGKAAAAEQQQQQPVRVWFTDTSPAWLRCRPSCAHGSMVVSCCA